jgi:hypothetical protein
MQRSHPGRCATAALVLAALLCHAQSSAPQDVPLSPEERQLLQAQSANEAAQEEYYRLQAAKLRETPTTQSFWRKVTDTPASVLGVGGAIIASLVTLLSFFFNYRSTLQSQRDTQFYEALKRFADKDSPAMRISATGMLAQMAHRDKRPLPLRGLTAAHGVKGQPHLPTLYGYIVTDQLIAGMQLEEHPLVLDAIGNALAVLYFLDRRVTLLATYATNLKLQDALVTALAEFAASLDIQEAPPAGASFWEAAERAAGYSSYILHTLVMRRTTVFKRSLRAPSAVGQTKTGLSPKLAHRTHLSAARLRANVNAFCLIHHLASALPSTALEAARNLNGIFLAGGDLHYADLRGLHLADAQLQEADLRNTKLERTLLKGAHLAGARLDEDNETLRFTNWWEADFSMGADIDRTLLKQLCSPPGDSFPSEPDKLHPSVRAFLRERNDLPDSEEPLRSQAETADGT